MVGPRLGWEIRSPLTSPAAPCVPPQGSQSCPLTGRLGSSGEPQGWQRSAAKLGWEDWKQVTNHLHGMQKAWAWRALVLSVLVTGGLPVGCRRRAASARGAAALVRVAARGRTPAVLAHS